MIRNPKIDLLMNTTALFKIKDCYFCRMYSFIESINQKLPISEQIEIIDCTNYHDYEITDNPKIPLFVKYYGGNYPSLIIKGQLISGANTEEELIASIKGRFHDLFETEEDMSVEIDGQDKSLIFNKSCRFEKKGFWRKKISCIG